MIDGLLVDKHCPEGDLLILEEDAIILRILRELLEGEGFREGFSIIMREVEGFRINFGEEEAHGEEEGLILGVLEF